MTKEELKNRTKRFAIDTILFPQTLPKSKANDVIIYHQQTEINRLLKEANELTAIFTATSITTKRNIELKKKSLNLNESKYQTSNV